MQHDSHAPGQSYHRALPPATFCDMRCPGKRPKVVAVALANKTARIAWALLRRNEIYAAPVS